MEETPKKRGGWLWLILILLALVAAGIWQSGILVSVGSESGIYQAVFLTNNQVYFGKLEGRNSQYPVLKDIYYLQVTQTLQPRDQNAAPTTQINLIKLGGELHGPTDAMTINRDHILFFEDLKDDSQVVKAIQEDKQRQAQP